MTHVTCRLSAKNRDQLRNPVRSSVEYGLPLPFFTTSTSRLVVAGGPDQGGYIFYAGGSIAGVSCRRRWPPPTTLALTTLVAHCELSGP